MTPPPSTVSGSMRITPPSGDAYKPAESLDRRAARDFHRPQIDALARAGVDFLHLATAPNVEEALGVELLAIQKFVSVFSLSKPIRRTAKSRT
ncbi:homocysteine S-methyltransferase family protein [Methylocystis echinoides]|uniref:homocysteine S-methyltransferase family protein n=1 Tax=Methylocystis echinoides TaxID=29468 RepID=UPI003D812C1F